MTPAEALTEALQRLLTSWLTQGVRVTMQAGRLQVEITAKRAPVGVADTIRRLEPELVALLQHRPLDLTWRDRLARWPADWVEEHLERSGIREFEAGFERPVADLLAFRDLMERFRHRGGG